MINNHFVQCLGSAQKTIDPDPDPASQNIADPTNPDLDPNFLSTDSV